MIILFIIVSLIAIIIIATSIKKITFEEDYQDPDFFREIEKFTHLWLIWYFSEVNKKEIPDHTLLVGGFPCQDYSVARSLVNEKGIEGKKVFYGGK